METQISKFKSQPVLPKKLTYRTQDRFRRNFFRRNPVLTGKIRSFGGHQ